MFIDHHQPFQVVSWWTNIVRQPSYVGWSWYGRDRAREWRYCIAIRRWDFMPELPKLWSWCKLPNWTEHRHARTLTNIVPHFLSRKNVPAYHVGWHHATKKKPNTKENKNVFLSIFSLLLGMWECWVEGESPRVDVSSDGSGQKFFNIEPSPRKVEIGLERGGKLMIFKTAFTSGNGLQ